MHLLTEPPCRTPTLLNLEFIGSNHPPASVAEIRRTNPCWILSSKFLSLPAPPISKSYPSLPVLIPSAAQTSQVWLRPEPVPVLLSPSEKLTVNGEVRRAWLLDRSQWPLQGSSGLVERVWTATGSLWSPPVCPIRICRGLIPSPGSLSSITACLFRAS